MPYGFKNCPDCGKKIPSGSKHCPKCNFAFGQREEVKIAHHNIKAKNERRKIKIAVAVGILKQEGAFTPFPFNKEEGNLGAAVKILKREKATPEEIFAQWTDPDSVKCWLDVKEIIEEIAA